jgi:hypothetical protein
VTQQDRTALVALREALQDAVDDAEARWDMDSPSTNPGIKGWVERGRAALSALPSGGAEPQSYRCPWCEDVKWAASRKRPKEVDAAQCPNCGCYAPANEPSGGAEAYPGGDRGLLAMTERWADYTKATRIGVLRGIQEAAFRAGREDALSGGAEGPTREQVEALVHDAYTNGLALPETVGPRATRMADAYCRDVLALYAEPAKEQK